MVVVLNTIPTKITDLHAENMAEIPNELSTHLTPVSPGLETTLEGTTVDAVRLATAL